MLELRENQKLVINQLRRDWKSHRTHLIYASVGFGKTVIAAFIAKGFSDRGMRVLMTCPYTVLVEQTFTRFIQFGLPKPGIIWQKHPETDYARQIQVASVDTLVNREFPEYDVLIVDECHLKNKAMLEHIKSTDKKVIGLSGTPFSKWLGNYYENLIKVTTMRQLINDKSLSDYEFYAPISPNLDKIKTANTSMGNDYIESQLDEVMRGADIVGNIVENWLKNGDYLPTVCFCVTVAHANYVTVEFNKYGVRAEVMDASTPIQERQRIIKLFEDGVVKVICNVGVLVAGFDSDVRCIIYARPTKSEMRWIQCLGRGLRTAKGKNVCKIFDHSGTVHRLGFPDSIEYDELPSESDGMDEVSSKRQEKEKKEKLPKECPSCNYMKPAGQYICEKCGFKPVVGENVEVDETREIQAITKVRVEKEDKQRFYSELLGYQNERKLKGKPLSDGWVANKYRDKFDVWPKGLSKIALTPSPKTRGIIRQGQIAFSKKNKSEEKAKEQARETLNQLKEILND